MKTDFLKGLGIEQTAIDAIMRENGLDIEKFKNAANAEKERADGLQSELDTAKATLKGFEGVDVDALRKEVADWKIAAEQAKSNAAEEVKQARISDAINAGLKGAKCRNAELVTPLLKMDAITFKDGKVSGITEQISALQKGKDTAFLFETEAPTKTGMRQFGGEGNITDLKSEANAAIRAAFGNCESF